MKFNIKELVPHFIILVIFWAITAAYFKPLLSGDMTLPQHDIKQWKAGAKELIDYREDNDGEESMWTNSMFGGMPSYLVSTVYASNLTNSVKRVMMLGIPYPASTLLIAMISAYIMFLSFKVRNPYIAGMGAIGFALASFMCISIGAGHNAKVVAIALAPLVIGGINLIFDRKYLIGFALTALGIALEVGAGHIQITYYLFLLLLIYGISQTVFHIIDNKAKEFGITLGVLVLAVLLGVSANASRLMTIKEYGEYSTRGKSELSKELTSTFVDKEDKELEEENTGDGLPAGYAFKWSQGVFENFTFLVPHLFGGGSYGSLDDGSETYDLLTSRFNLGEEQALNFVQQVPLYSGRQPGTAGPIYMGAIICALFIVGLFILDNRYRWWLLAGFILSVFLSMGKNFPEFNLFMFNYFPGYNKFRTVSMTVVIAQFVMPLTAVLALNKLITDREDKKVLQLASYGLITVVGILLIIILFAGGFNFVSQYDAGFRQMLKNQVPVQMLGKLMDALVEDRISLARMDAIRSLLFILGASGAIYLIIIKKLKVEIAVGIIALLVLVDLWPINKKYLNDDKYVEVQDQEMIDQQMFPLTPASRTILKDKSHYRVYDVSRSPFNDATSSYYHHSIGGYHGAKMRRYQDLISMHIANNNRKVIDMLNVKYIIQSNMKVMPLENIGNAWLVKNLIPVESADAEIKFLGDNKFDPQNNAVVNMNNEHSTFTKTDFNDQGTVDLVTYKPNYLKYDVNAKGDAFVVFSEIFYPEGWIVTINGKEVEDVRVNYVLRGLEVPQGAHTVEFKFEPTSYYVGENISFIGSILIFLSFGVVGFLFYKKGSEAQK